MQGFYYAAAMRADEIEPFMAQWHASPRSSLTGGRRAKGAAADCL
jgi:hypothetical protein